MSKLRDFVDHITWPQVVALGLVLLAAFGLVHEILPHIPADAWAQVDITRVIILLVTGGGATGALALGQGLVRKPEQVAAARASRTSLGSDTKGHAVVDAMLAAGALTALAWAALRAWAPHVLSVLGLGVALLCAPGCGASALQVHATVASLTGTVIDEGCTAVQHERDVEQRAAVDANATREAASAAVTAVRLRWDPYVAACNLAVDAQNAWATALALFGVTGRFDLGRSLALAAPVLRIYDDFVALHPPLSDGVTLPALPAQLLALVATPVEVTP